MERTQASQKGKQCMRNGFKILRTALGASGRRELPASEPSNGSLACIVLINGGMVANCADLIERRSAVILRPQHASFLATESGLRLSPK